MRSDILTIAKKPHTLIGEDTIDEIDYSKWADFIEALLVKKSRAWGSLEIKANVFGLSHSVFRFL